MKRILMTTAAALTVAFPAFAQTPAAGGAEATPKWDVQNPIGAQRDVNINVKIGLSVGWRGGSGCGGRRESPVRPSRWRLGVRALAKQCFASKAPSPM